MSDAAVLKKRYAGDCAITLRNRARLSANRNLLYWYGELYRHQFQDHRDPQRLKILEIGSGASPFQRSYQNLTSDVLQLGYLDYVFDCHSIDQCDQIADRSLDLIALTNVLRHLRDPVGFLNKAVLKVKLGGKVNAPEPYFSTISTLIFVFLHHEPVDCDISEPVLSEVRVPFAFANIALPWLIFFKNPSWRNRLQENFAFEVREFQPFRSISYMATGGISRRVPIPSLVYRTFFRLDMVISRKLPKLFASFVRITLTRR